MYFSQLRAPHLSSNGGAFTYTPPPILAPMRNGSGLFWQAKSFAMPAQVRYFNLRVGLWLAFTRSLSIIEINYFLNFERDCARSWQELIVIVLQTASTSCDSTIHPTTAGLCLQFHSFNFCYSFCIVFSLYFSLLQTVRVKFLFLIVRSLLHCCGRCFSLFLRIATIFGVFCFWPTFETSPINFFCNFVG